MPLAKAWRARQPSSARLTMGKQRPLLAPTSAPHLPHSPASDEGTDERKAGQQDDNQLNHGCRWVREEQKHALLLGFVRSGATTASDSQKHKAQQHTLMYAWHA